MTVRRSAYFVAITAILARGVAQASPVLLLNPSGVVSGLAGLTVGWGFTLTNDVDFLVPSFVNFCLGAYSSAPCPTAQGTFTDFLSGFQAVSVGPGATLTQTFNNAAHRGIGGFAINPGAVGGAKDIGTMYLLYDRFSCDIINDPSCTSPIQTAFSLRLGVFAEVDVLVNNSVPEPGTFYAVGIALSVMTAARRKRKRLSLTSLTATVV